MGGVAVFSGMAPDAGINAGIDAGINTGLLPQLALKHRQGKNHKMRIIAFVGSPVHDSDKDVSAAERGTRDRPGIGSRKIRDWPGISLGSALGSAWNWLWDRFWDQPRDGVGHRGGSLG